LVTEPDLARFSGFADLYDAHRPSAPARLGPLLARYAGVEGPRRPVVVDLGSGTGLSSRWAATWAEHVIGVEPNGDMRSVAEGRATPGVTYVAGTSDATGLADEVADVVLAVQAMHWMEPSSTHAEVARILRPGGVFAVVDADWPPVSGLVAAERAWVAVHRRIRVLEARLAHGLAGEALRAPVADDDPELADDDPADPHLNRTMRGTRSWSKRDHLRRLRDSGRFAFVRELLLDQDVAGGASEFVEIMRSQGSYQGLVKAGLTDEEIGVDAFAAEVAAAFAAAADPSTMSFSYRVRLGVTADARLPA
jgi:SAM-dependent methyltransferase